MSLQIYVGNYPLYFSPEDVVDIFNSFEGIHLEKFCKQKNKCFSFLSCKNMEQIVSVVESMNNFKVSGRNLIVRAKDHKMQDYINILLQENRSENSKSLEKASISGFDRKISKNSQVFDERKPLKCDELFENESLSSVRLKRGHFRGTFNNSNQSPQDSSSVASDSDKNVCSDLDIPSPNGSTSTRDNKFSERYLETSVSKEIDHSISARDSYHKISVWKENEDHLENVYTDSTNLSTGFTKTSQRNHEISVSKENEDHSENIYIDRTHLSTGINEAIHSHHTSASKQNGDHLENLCTDIKNLATKVSKTSDGYHKTSVSNGKSSESVGYSPESKDLSFEKDSDISNEDIEACANGVWVSVTNFPIGTSVHALLDLFCDYNPLGIRVICNVPRSDKTITEVIVCFSNQDVANDVIMTFDNTIYKRRILLVNDIEDLTVLKELLVVGQH